MPGILFAARSEDWPRWEPHLRKALDATGLDYELATDLPPDRVDYIIYAPNGPVQDFSPYSRLKAVLSTWAGVERIVGNPTLKVPLARMVDPGLTAGMVEYVVGNVLRHHLGLDRYIINPDHVWAPAHPPLASERSVTVLGLGALGRAAAEALSALGFDVHGWSRTPKRLAGITCHAGKAGLDEALSRAEILVALLPATPETENILDARALALLPEGAAIINPGRGTLIDDAALLEALETGQVGHATLDVFRIEPLPPDHPFWSHPRVTVTPHVAADTRPSSASVVLAENIRRAEAGEPLLHVVDRSAGY